MSNRLHFPVSSIDRDIALLAGRVAIGATGAPTVDSAKGVSVARTGTGQYTLTIDDKYVDILHCNVSYPDDGTECLVQSIVDSTNVITIQFQTESPSTLADADLADGSFFTYVIVAKNSSVG